MLRRINLIRKKSSQIKEKTSFYQINLYGLNVKSISLFEQEVPH
jgi:hypothetical protein